MAMPTLTSLVCFYGGHVRTYTGLFHDKSRVVVQMAQVRGLFIDCPSCPMTVARPGSRQDPSVVAEATVTQDLRRPRVWHRPRPPQTEMSDLIASHPFRLQTTGAIPQNLVP